MQRDAQDRGPEGADPAAVSVPTPFQPQYAAQAASWWQLIGLFAKLGVVAFGGPVAHIAIMDKEVVERRRWIDRRHFLDLIAATNLLPGPNSTQMTMHIGYVQRGNLGVVAAGTAFILPAALITLAVTWAYATYRDLPVMDAVFAGIQPVVLAIIATAIVKLAPQAADDLRTRVVFVAALALGLFGVNELLVLALGAVAGLLATQRWASRGTTGLLVLTTPWLLGAARASGSAEADTLGQLAWLFFKFGITLFGSGYLLVAYLQRDLVERTGLLSASGLLEALVIGEMTPGPLFTVSTAVGYLLGGVPGAAVATSAIFLPSFFLAMALGRLMPAVKRSDAAKRLLSGLTAAVLGVMLAVTVELALRVIVDVPAGVLAAAALATLIWTRVSAIALIPLGGLIGFLWLEVLG